LFYRREFCLSGDLPRRAILHITALGIFEGEINGQRVGEDVFAPGWTDYRKRVYYYSYDVTSLLRAGENVIGVILGDGWYSGHVAERNRELYGEAPALLASIDGETTSVVVTDGQWTCARGPILENDLIMGESYDARRELPGWSSPGCLAGEWMPVRKVDAPAISIDRPLGPPVRRHEILPGRPVAGPEDVHWLPSRRRFDFGQNFSGRVRLRVRGPRGLNIQLLHGEMLYPDGSLFTANLRTARATDNYTLKGGGEVEEWEPRLTFHGFRYAELVWQSAAEPLEIESVEGVALYSDMARTGAFECSHPLLNKLASNILWGQKSNFLEVPTDCPQRDERLGWTGDAQVFIRTAAFFMDVRSFFRKWFCDMRDVQASDGIIPPIIPDTNSYGRPNDGGPAWADAVFICPWTAYLCYGDVEFLRENYDCMVRYFDYLLAHKVKDNIRCHPDVDAWGGFGDWLALDGSEGAFGATPKDLIGTAYFAYAADILAKSSDLIGRPEEAERYRGEYGQIKRAFQERFVAENGEMKTPTQTACVLALHFDLLPEALRPVVARQLVRLIEANGNRLATGFIGTPYILPALEATGHLDVAYRLLEQEAFPSWLFPVTHGATTIWERWNGWTPETGLQGAEMNSFNHYAYGAVGAWMVSAVAGLEIDPLEPGYRHIRFKPRPGGTLTHAKASLETLHGRVAIAWRIEEGELRLELEVPLGTRATLDLPPACNQPPIALKEGSHNLRYPL
jgi:alpha-L-rhamnosidase